MARYIWSKRVKILTILGARPQFIKAGSLSRELKNYPKINEIIVHTGQHYDTNMSDVFFNDMQIPKPNYFLGIGGKSHGAMTGQMIEKIEEVVLIENPDWIIVYGDTNSTLAGAIVASKLHIKLAHIEAGLRSFNMEMPEEVNRILTDRISNILFCPTYTAVKNLKNEGFDNFNCKIVQTGDVMLDGAIFYKELALKPKNINSSSFILSTVHRAENTDNELKLRNIFKTLIKLSEDKEVILPLHPRTKKRVLDLNISLDKLTVIEPVGYLEMVWLISNCDIIITDSGGLQKEAYFFKKPCITLREETEWIELVENNVNILVGTQVSSILDAYKQCKVLQVNNKSQNLYGDGQACKTIIQELLK
jgi:UDP-GlcNAc3NAcA epimerase